MGRRKEIVSGVYRIINTITGGFYYGSSYDIEKRFREHKYQLMSNKHHSIYLQRSWDKHGKEAFVFEIVELCDKQDCLKIEQKYLDQFNPVYNTSKNSTSPMKGRKHTKETIEKFKRAPRKSGIESPSWGKKHSEETRKRMSDSHLGSTRTEETKAKMRETAIRLNRKKDILPSIAARRKKVLDSLGNEFDSMVECAKFHDISVQTVCDILKGRHSFTRKKVSFKYA